MITRFESLVLSRLRFLEEQVVSLRRQSTPRSTEWVEGGRPGPGCEYCNWKGSILRRTQSSSKHFRRVSCPECGRGRRH